ncbi:BZ3500_MvSof-1268-A1-R1_Chr10-1g02760 [Microbotryum saponariae]|uniref:BZ3500_MvSof-1268-A1-R1_Chr10-1g02760 protein n=1 Tax=Microbotryum saponariae TaxID=289078 RepID=A0A2X0LK49_9BASI|nr:BZ3500_MvSof-1268-A1-R1_Chr10-1g02760 [Microbotryum saponariae]SDA06249.1 BZ3501_MvSof-1269-A2-R1_Chr10-1g02361 [Microbotryum saponariae]
MPSATRFIPSYNHDSANNENCYYEVIDTSGPSCHYIDADFTPPSIDNSAEKALITRNAASYFPGPQLEHRVGTPFEEPYAKRVITDILDKVLLSLRRRLGGSEGVVEEIWVLCCWSPPKLWDELNCSLTLGRMIKLVKMRGNLLNTSCHTGRYHLNDYKKNVVGFGIKMLQLPNQNQIQCLGLLAPFPTARSSKYSRQECGQKRPGRYPL